MRPVTAFVAAASVVPLLAMPLVVGSGRVVVMGVELLPPVRPLVRPPVRPLRSWRVVRVAVEGVV